METHFKTSDGKFIIKNYSITELAHIYGIHNVTLKKWLKPHQEKIGLQAGRYFTPHQIEIIIEILGLPNSVD